MGGGAQTDTHTEKKTGRQRQIQRGQASEL